MTHHSKNQTGRLQTAQKALHAAHMGAATDIAVADVAYIQNDDIEAMRNDGHVFPTARGAVNWLRREVKKNSRGTLALYFSVIKTILRQCIDEVIDEVILVSVAEEVKIFFHPKSYDGKHFFFCVISQRELKTARDGDEEIVKALLDVNIMISDYHDALESRMQALSASGKTRSREYIALSKEVLVQNTIAAIEANVAEALVNDLAGRKIKEYHDTGVYGVSIKMELQKTGDQIDAEPAELDDQDDQPLLGSGDPACFFDLLAAHTRTCKSPMLADSYRPSAAKEIPETQPKESRMSDFFGMMKRSVGNG